MVFSLDIAKVFDRVRHKVLLSKLTSYGLLEKLCEWVTSFLTDRSIKVVVDGEFSDNMSVNAGVPQVCVLSPTLFFLHINYMLQISESDIMWMTALVSFIHRPCQHFLGKRH